MEAEQPQAGSEAGDVAAADAAFGQMLFGEEEPAQTQAQPQQEEEAPEPQAQPTEQPEAEGDGFEDVEYEGAQYRVPKALKDPLLRWSDYTKKTQETAHLRSVAQAEAQKYESIQKFNQDTSGEQQELARIKARIDEFKAVDLTSLEVQDYIKASGTLTALKERATELQQSLGGKWQQLNSKLEAERQTATKAAYEFVEKKIPGFKPGSDVEKALATYVQNSTVPVDVFGELARRAPEVVEWAHKAATLDKLQASKNTVLAQVKNAPPVVKPGANDPAMQAKMQELSELKALKGAKDRGSQMQYAEKVLGRFFERN
jgi:hypothetical protein